MGDFDSLAHIVGKTVCGNLVSRAKGVRGLPRPSGPMREAICDRFPGKKVVGAHFLGKNASFWKKLIRLP